MRVLIGVVAATGFVGLAAAGCSGTPTVEKASLETDISSRLETAGQTPESVTCSGDLEGVVGSTTTCEVVLSATNSIEPVVEVTGVEGSTVSYEMTPALSQQQLERSVSALVSQNAGQEVTGVTCDGGLRGEQGNETNCSMQLGGEPLDAVVSVTTVDGLLMNFRVSPV